MKLTFNFPRKFFSDSIGKFLPTPQDVSTNYLWKFVLNYLFYVELFVLQRGHGSLIAGPVWSMVSEYLFSISFEEYGVRSLGRST